MCIQTLKRHDVVNIVLSALCYSFVVHGKCFNFHVCLLFNIVRLWIINFRHLIINHRTKGVHIVIRRSIGQEAVYICVALRNWSSIRDQCTFFTIIIAIRRSIKFIKWNFVRQALFRIFT